MGPADLELVVSAGLEPIGLRDIAGRKAVWLLYDSNTLAVPALASYITYLGHVVIMPVVPGTGSSPCQIRTYRYETTTPFQTPDSSCCWRSIREFVREQTGRDRIHTIIAVGPPRVSQIQHPDLSASERSIASLNALLNRWSGAASSLIVEVDRTSQHEPWEQCFERYELAIERRHEERPLNRYHLRALNGVIGLSWMDCDGGVPARCALARRMEDVHSYFVGILDGVSFTQATPALAHLQKRRMAVLKSCNSPAKLFDVADPLFLCFLC